MAVALSCKDLSKTFGSRLLFAEVSLTLEDRERLALIGPNGSGKSTLLKILAGNETADQGQVSSRRGLRIAYVSQQDNFTPGDTLLAALTKPLLECKLASIHDEHEAELAAEMALDRAGFTDITRTVDGLSGGQRKRLAIIREIAKQPDVLLLDEPTNHLDVEGIQWLESLLRNGGFASIIVTHDRAFLESTASRIVELSTAYPKRTFSVEGNYTEFLRRKQEFLDGQAKMEASLANQVREDLRWLSRGAKARRTKSKSRIDASFDRMDELAQLKSRNAPQQAAQIDWTASGRMTHKLLTARAITKQLGGKKLFTDIDFILSPKQILGLLGPNGSGKSTLIKCITGEMELDPPTREAIEAAKNAVNIPISTPPPGTIKKADKLRIVLFSQVREDFDLGITLREALSPQSDSVIYQGRSLHINTWAKKFLFTAEQLKQPLRALSGGERARVHIARLMLETADILILDEPTNDLDIPSLEVLETSLEEFPGAVVLVSHDRAMLADLCTQILALDGEGNARMFVDYDQWETYTLLAIKEKQRGGKPSSAAPASSSPSSPAAKSVAPTSKPDPNKKKLTYNEQREFANMEGTIAALEARIAEFEVQMADPEISSDGRKMKEISILMGQSQKKLKDLYARWAELEARA